MSDEREGDGPDSSAEITAENVGFMIHEVGTVALHAGAAYSNGWTTAGEGFIEDMFSKWGGAGMVRMAYVFGASRFFLPTPPGRETITGPAALEQMSRALYGTAPHPEQMGLLISEAEQVQATYSTIATAASKGDVEAVHEELVRSSDRHGLIPLMRVLAADCGLRLRYSRDQNDTRSYELFTSHINAAFEDHVNTDDDPQKGNGDEDL